MRRRSTSLSITDPARRLSVDVLIEDPGWSDALDDAAGLCRRAAVAAWHGADGAAAGEASMCVLLANDDRVRELNRRFRAVDAPTNVLAFVAATAAERARAWRSRQPVMLGDVVVALGVVRREAAVDGKPLADHLSHMVVHGMLHLIGYDHHSDADAFAMERLEARVLDSLGVADPYAIDNGFVP